MAVKKTKVEVYGETSKYERSMRNVKRTSKSTSQTISSHWSKTFGTLTKLSAAFGIAGAAGFVMLGKNALDAADAIGKTADKVGIGTDALQEYRYAAELSGVAQAQLDNGLAAFTKRLGEAQVGTGALVTYLNKYNETLLANIQASGSTEEALGYIFEAMGKATSASDRAALSAAAFGRTAGIDMTNLVREGTTGLQQMLQAARDLGLVIDESLIRESEKANDALTTLKNMVSIQMTNALISMAPQITEITQNMTDWVSQNRVLIGQNMETVMRGLGGAFVFFGKSVATAATAYGKFLDLFYGPVIGDPKELAKQGLEKQLELALRSYQLMVDQGNIDQEILRAAEARILTLRQRIAILEESIKIRPKLLEAPKAPEVSKIPAVLGPTGKPLLAPLKSYDKITKELLGAGALRGEQMRELQMIQDELLAEQYMEQARGSLAAKSQLEIYMAGQLYHDLEAMGWDHRTIMEIIAKKETEDRKKQNAQRFADAQSAVGVMASSFQAISEMGGKQSKKAFDMYKAFKITETLMATYSSAIKAYESLVWVPFVGPALGAAAAAMAVAFGMAQVNMIRQAQPPTYDLGGISTTPGMYYSGVPEAHVPLKGGAIPVDLNAGRGAGDVFIIMENPVFQDLETQQAVIADIASQITERVAPNAVVRAYDNDHAIRGRIRSRA